MDNAVHLALVGGDEDVVALGTGIRQAGWVQARGLDGERRPMDELIAITLSRAQWAFVVAEAGSSARAYAELGDEESAALGRQAVTSISQHLH